MSSNDNKSRIRNGEIKEVLLETSFVSESNFWVPYTESLLIESSFLEPLNQVVVFDGEIPPSRTISRALNNFSAFELLDLMYGNSLMDSEERMMNIVMEESLNHYNTREKKPNVKICIKNTLATDVHTEENCAICKSEFEKDENINILKCKHIYHTECIGEWVKYKSECPVCRENIQTYEKSEEK